MLSSILPFAVATLGALAMALAFPKANAVILAPLGATGLFWAWFGVSPKRAFWVGAVAGTLFFYINFAWFGETAGALVAPFGFLLALAPALIEAVVGFGLAGVLCAFAARGLAGRSRVARALVPLAGAAAFAGLEWLRCDGAGDLGVPFASLGYSQARAIDGPVAAFAGTYGVTFLVCVCGAYAAYALRLRTRDAAAGAACAFVAVAATVSACTAFAPARHALPPEFPVAAVQGNISQTIKFRPAALAGTVDRYEALTLRAGAGHPRLIVWPETVIPVLLNRTPALVRRFAGLARRVRAEIVVGSLAAAAGPGEYNVLYVFAPDGTVATIYRKRRLVPFAEHLPFAALLGWMPWARDVSDFLDGSGTAVFDAGGLVIGPVICWESDFSALVNSDVRAGANALVVATDDAWFGTTAGPYMHAQTAQMRALESGRWIVRAASTGISGIIAPDGRYTHASTLGEAAIVMGKIGLPVATPYDALGPGAVASFFAALYVAAVAAGFVRP